MIAFSRLFFLLIITITNSFYSQGVIIGAAVVTADLEDAITSLLVTSSYNNNESVDQELIDGLDKFQRLYLKRNLYKITNVTRLRELQSAVNNLELKLDSLSNRNQSILLRVSKGPFRLNSKAAQLEDAIEGIRRRLDLFKDLPDKMHNVNIISGERTILVQQFKHSLDIINKSVNQLEYSTSTFEHILDKLYQSGKSIFKK